MKEQLIITLYSCIKNFDQQYEYLTVEINEEYLGTCDAGKQAKMYNNLFTTRELDAQCNNYSFWCFGDIDISRYINIESEERLTLQETVDTNWLDLAPTSCLLDVIIEMNCVEKRQDEFISNAQTYKRSNIYPYAHEKTKCQKVECGAIWEWNVFAVTLSTQDGVQNATTCFKGLELHELLNNWKSRHNFNGSPDAVINKFQFSFALTEMEELDGIANGSVAQLYINLNCSMNTRIKDNDVFHVTGNQKDVNGFSHCQSELNCVHAD